MRISELSRHTGVPTPTIKYYLREGLLQPGRPTAATQAQYDDAHARRLRMIRALAETGGLSLGAIRRVIRAMEDEDATVHRMLGAAHYALGPHVEVPDDDPEWAAARHEVDAFLSDLGWRVSPYAPARDALTKALLALRQLGIPASRADLQAYAEAVRPLAERELRLVAEAGTREETVRAAVVGNVLNEPVLLALRRLAQEDESARRFDDTRQRWQDRGRNARARRPARRVPGRRTVGPAQ